MASQKEHFREAERLIALAKKSMNQIQEILPDISVREIDAAIALNRMVIDTAQVHATLATAKSPDG